MSETSPELIPLDAPALVEASAGTGKTYAITTYFVRAIVEVGLRPEEILVVTYTKAATAELRSRARNRVLEALRMLDEAPSEPSALYEVLDDAIESTSRREVEARLRKALGQMDQTAISTIHGFCQRLLQERPLSFGTDLEIEVAEHVRALHADLARDFWATRVYDEPAWFLDALKGRRIDVEDLEKLANVATMPGVEVIGPEPCDVDPGTFAGLTEAHVRAGRIWFSEREEILRLLGTEGLRKNIYKADTIEKTWVPGLDRMFALPTFQTLPKYFRWLCTSGVDAKWTKKHDPPRHGFFDACEELAREHARLQPNIAYAVYAFQRDFCEYVREQSHARRTEGVFSFDDLLTTVHEVVTRNQSVARAVREAYPLALVDEFQDTDSIQYGIFRAIYGEGSAIYVGDPKQAIYAFRGADVYSYLAAKKDVEDRTCTLETNRRSDPGVVRATNALFSRQTPPFLIDGIGFEPVKAHVQESRTTLSPPLDFVFLRADDIRGSMAERVAPVVANEVAVLLESGALIDGQPVGPWDIAVLCRTNNQGIAVTNALRKIGIPTSLDGDASVLNTAIANDLTATLEAALLPGDSRAIRRALLGSLIGVTPEHLASMNDEEWSAWVGRFREWNEAWHKYGVLRFLEAMFEHADAETKLARRPSANRDLTDLLHLQELLLRGEGQTGRDPVALMQWFRRLMDGYAEAGMAALEDLQQRPDAELGAVRVTTIHKSKGLEYSVVFCPFTWGDAKLFQFDRKAVKYHGGDGSLRVDLGSTSFDEHLAQAEREARSEALRLLYVAVTRAKHQCVVFWGKRDTETSALAYLLHDRDSLRDLEEDKIRSDLESVAAELGEDAGCREPHPRLAPSDVERSDPDELAAREAVRTFHQSARISSFTSLTGHDDKAPGPSIPQTTSPLFAQLPGGKRTGLLLHAILERGAHEAFLEDEGKALIEKQLGLHGFDEELASVLQQDLSTVASTRLLVDPSLPALAKLDRKRQLRELEFMLAVEQPSLEQLSAILRQHAVTSTVPDYHARLAAVTGQTLRGFLQGFIDLVFEVEGRWYVADYKSNRLPGYGVESVTEAVQREHYVLQGLLYSAAAHRYLRQRIAEYDPVEHFGGMLFLFLRGMEGAANTGAGVFFDRPSPALLDALDSWLGGNDGSR